MLIDVNLKKLKRRKNNKLNIKTRHKIIKSNFHKIMNLCFT